MFHFFFSNINFIKRFNHCPLNVWKYLASHPDLITLIDLILSSHDCSLVDAIIIATVLFSTKHTNFAAMHSGEAFS